MSRSKFQSSTSFQMFQIFFVCLSVNVLVLLFSSLMTSTNIVFGTQSLTPSWGLFLSMGVLALINMLSVPIFESIQNESDRELTMKEWMIGYYIINFFGLWSISRFAEQFGIGFTSWGVVAIVALILDFVQGFAIMKFVYSKNN